MDGTVKNVLVFIGGVAAGMLGSFFLVIISRMVLTQVEIGEEEDTIRLVLSFLTHFFTAFIGGIFVGRFASTHNKQLAIAIGVFFMLFGIIGHMMAQTNLSFIIIDLALAYIPAALLGYKIGFKRKYLK